jgi:hypothetical protein
MVAASLRECQRRCGGGRGHQGPRHAERRQRGIEDVEQDMPRQRGQQQARDTDR